MSSGCGDVLSLEDLRIAKLHQIFEAEVITGRQGGSPTGAAIDYAINQVTGQSQKTLPAILRDVGYTPASFDFASGGTLATGDRDVAVLWPLSAGGDGDYYYWQGALPKVIPAGSTPASTGGVADGAWRPVGDLSLRNELIAANSGFLVDSSNVKSSPVSGVNRTQLSKNSDFLSLKDFGAVGDGTTNDTAAIQRAVDYSSANGVGIYAPSGRYKVDTIILKPNMSLRGEYIGNEGKGTSFLGNGVDDVFKGLNSDSLLATAGQSATVPYAHHVTLQGFEIDGGVNGVSKAFSTSLNGRGIAIFGSSLNFVDIDVINTGSHGIESAYHDSSEEWPLYFRESSFRNIKIRNVGKHGWWYKGPHDAKLIDVSVINASRCADNTYDGYISEVEGSCDIVAMHCSCSGTRAGDYQNIRHRYSGNLGGGCHVVASSFEGARSAGVLIKGSFNYMDSACSVYAPFGTENANTPLILMSGASNCTIKGTVDGNGYPASLAPVGLKFDAANPSNANYIDLQFTTIPFPISFGSSTSVADGDAGDNHITGNATYYGTASFATYGVLNSKMGSSLDLQFIGKLNTRLSSRRQSNIMTIAAGATGVWNFKFPFRSANPIVVGMIQSPSGSGNVSNGYWISLKSQNSVSIYNATTQQITLNLIAEEPVQVT